MVTSLKRLVVLLLVMLSVSAQAAPVFPVKYSANNRYLVDQSDTPFPIMGRTAWFITALSVADSHTFIDDTAARGYNAVELHVVNHDPRGNNPPFDGNGNLPFLNRLDGTTWDDGALSYGNINNEAPDFTTPNEAYWSLVDGFLSYCESKGILVFLFPAYVGYQGEEQGWMQEMVANGTTNMQSYGAWIATRYQNQKNIVWMMGGDFGDFDTAQSNAEGALLTGLKSVPGQQSVLFSAEWQSDWISTDQETFGASMTLNGVYSFSGDVNEHGRRAYAHNPVEPAFLLEEPFDEEGSDGNGYNPSATQPVRRFQWWGWLSTIGGYISGNAYVIFFRAPSWRDHLDTQGSRDMGRLNAFIGSIAWYKLVPSGLNGMRTLITAGGSSESSSDYVAAAAAPDGTLLVAYVPPTHSGPITVDMGAMSGPTRARWFDPTSGQYNDIGTGLTNTGARVFTVPGNNSVGETDWVLLLDPGDGPPPTISDIADQATTVNTPTAAIPFTINDADTPIGNLTLSAGSSNPVLVPTSNIVFGGSGANRTVRVTPATGQTGTAAITVGVSDGTNTTSDTFVLTVNAVNTPPTITRIADQTINEDSSTVPLGFTVGDAETAAGSLTLSKGSSNPGLVPTSNIVFGGSGSNRTVTVSPAAHQTGTATITVGVSDGTLSGSTNFVVTVSAVNDAPTITGIANQTINVNGTTVPLGFTIGDVDTPLTGLTLSAGSSNPVLVPANNIVFGGSGSNRTVTVSPVSGQTGNATITVTVNDGPNNTSTSFVVTVNPSATLAGSFTNAAVITIPSVGNAMPYPSTINVTGTSGTISNVTVTLRGLSHSWGDDIDVLLVGPGGQKVTLMSDAGTGPTANGADLTFSDAAAGTLPQTGSLVSGTYRPTDYSPTDTYGSPAPAGPYGTFLSAFNGQSANGTWSLYVVDDGAGDAGSFAGGWSLTLTTLAPTSSATPTISDIPDQSTTVNTTTVAIPFTIADEDTPVANLTLGRNSSNATLVPTNNIVFGGSGSNRTVTVIPATGQTGTATITVTVSDGINSASDTFVLTVNAVNTPPTITRIADQTINEDTSTAAIGFTVGDAETAPGSLTLSKGSSNPTLVPTNNVVFGGTGANRTVTVTPAANQNGTATITVTVSDGTLSGSTNFVVTVSAVNDAPTITGIANQTINVNGTTVPLGFTIGDVDTPLTGLTLSAGSSNPVLVPANNIVFGGSGSNRTVTVSPAANQTGSATITVTISDGTNSASDAFVLTVNAVNTPPMITRIADQTINEDSSTVPLGFTVGDAETAAGSLTLSKGSSNPVLVPTSNIVFGGSGSNRTVTVSPAADQTGTATITVGVSDGTLSGSTNFVVTVNAVNDGPTITGIANQTINVNGTTVPLGFTIGDVDTPLTGLTLSAGSSNPVLMPANNIVFGGSGSNRTVTVSPVSGQTGNATITVTVNDGPNNTSTSFVVTVNPFATLAGSFTNAAVITIPSVGNATPYPSTINVTGTSGTISNVTVTLRGLSHSWGDDIDVLLVGPGGQKVTLMSDAGTGPTANGADLTFSDAAAGTLPQTGSLVSGTYRPTDYSPTDTYGSPAPAGPYGTFLSAFNGQSANGTWSLYVVDDGAGDAGSFAGGWSLTLTTLAPTSSATPTISDIPDQSTPVNTTTVAIPFTIADADTPVGNLVLSASSSNPTLVPTNNIVFGGSGSSRTVTVSPAANQTGSATITVTVSDGSNSASDAFVLTVNAVNTPPMITRIADQTINEDSSTVPLGFTVGDAETAPGSLTLSKGSSNPVLVPTNNIVFGGSGANRTATVTPAANQNGTATITVTVSDGQSAASTNFVVTVSAVNDAPTITGIANQTINANTSTGPLSFTIGDVETAAGSLALSGASSNPTLVPANNIVFGGSGANRTVTVTPASNQTGSATITVGVSDGQVTTSTNFIVTVSAVNDAPTITGIANQTINANTSTGPLSFTIGDVETAAGSLALSGASSNPALVPANNIVFGGSGSNRTVTVTPASNQTGSATITVGVSDGQVTTSTNFIVTVSSVFVGTKSFTNTTAITIPDSGKATPYPSTINVTGMDGTITNMTVMLRDFNHTWKSDVDILLASPGGQKVKLMSDAGSAYTASGSVTITLSDAAAGSLPVSAAISSGTYKPTDYTDSSSGGDNFPAPAPAVPYATTLSAFNGQSPNGIWSLYVFDDGPGDLGSFAGGWSVTISTATASFLPGPPELVSLETPPKITSMTFDQDGVQLTVNGEVGRRYALEASSDLKNWNKVAVQDNTTGSVVFSDQPATNSIRFYRAMAMPQ